MQGVLTAPSLCIVDPTDEEMEALEKKMSHHGARVPEAKQAVAGGRASKIKSQFLPRWISATMGKTPVPLLAYVAAEASSQKNISQTRSTEAQGRVRAKMHMNHWL